MELPIVVAVFALIPYWTLAVETRNTVYADPMHASSSILRRDTASHDNIIQSIHKRLVQQSETLEKLMAVVQRNEELTKTIREYLNKKLEDPKIHETVKLYPLTRRSHNENEEIPIVKFGKDIVRYGNLLKTVLMSDITKEPYTTVAETNIKINKTPNK